MHKLNSFFFRRHLDNEETLLMVVHKHWLIGIKFLFWPTTSFFAAWWALYNLPIYAIFYVAAIWATVSLIWWFRNFFDYYLDAWIISDQGIMDVEWHGWFHRESTRVLFSDIQGVSYEINGIAATMLGFGCISVEKVSTGNVIELDYVPEPRKVEKVILKNMEGYMHNKNLKDSRHVQEILSQMVANEIQLQELSEEDDNEDDSEDDI
ncbi:MAG: PH domain-containing protein [bacterium]|nr:PH domain-containing protein [bacterium]